MPPAETTGLTKLYVTDLPPGVESEALRECFSKFGELGEVVVKHGEGDRSHFGFVWTNSLETANAIMAQPHQLGEVTIPAPVMAKNQRKTNAGKISAAKQIPPVDPRAAPDKIFVGGLSSYTTIDTFREYFTTYGAVKDAVIMNDRMTNRSRGFGFVTFEEAQSVSSVLAAQYHEVDGGRVEVKPALPKEAMVDEALAAVPPKLGGLYPDAGASIPFVDPSYAVEPAMGYHMPSMLQYAFGVPAPSLSLGVRVEQPESSTDPLAGSMEGMSLGTTAAPAGAPDAMSATVPPMGMGYPPPAYMTQMMIPQLMMRGVPFGSPIAYAPVPGSPGYMAMPMTARRW